MQREFIHTLFSSFCIWFDHHLLQYGSGFTNTSGKLYNVKDIAYSGAAVFSSPFKQWVYDSSVSGAQVPSGVYLNNTFLPRSTSGMFLDFQNGRAIFPSGAKNNITSSYSIKDFNIYPTTRSDAELVFETRYLINPTIPQIATGTNPDQIIAPCVFLKTRGMDSKPFSFGGQDLTNVNFRAVVMAADEFSLLAVSNIFIDSERSNFLMISGSPLNRYGDVRNGYYNYVSDICNQFNTSNLAFIEKVSFVKLNHESIAMKFPDLYVGFLDFKVSAVRNPRGYPEYLTR